MPRPKIFQTRIMINFTTVMLDRIAAVQRDGETRLDFIRKAIENELERREGSTTRGGRTHRPPTN